MKFEPVSGQIIRVALDVHSELGPGLLESAYRACLSHDLTVQGFNVQKEVPLPVHYHGVQLELGYRLDLVVEEVVVEIKTVTKLLPVHEAPFVVSTSQQQARGFTHQFSRGTVARRHQADRELILNANLSFVTFVVKAFGDDRITGICFA